MCVPDILRIILRPRRRFQAPSYAPARLDIEARFPCDRTDSYLHSGRLLIFYEDHAVCHSLYHGRAAKRVKDEVYGIDRESMVKPKNLKCFSGS